jgi:signal transduction histidine kinase
MEQEKWLVVRTLTMIGIVAAGMLITGWERTRRREAVAAERQGAEENLQLQLRAQQAEREVQEERIRISQEIHDGAAQSAYVLSLGLERCSWLAEGRNDELAQKLKALCIQSRQAQWQFRYPVNLGPLFEGRTLGEVLRDHTRNFETITSIPTGFSETGSEAALPAVFKQKLFWVAHNALTNVYRHARASRSDVELAFTAEAMTLSVRDNGVGFPTADSEPSPGHGLRNIQRIAQELGGSSDIRSDPGKGTTVSITLPCQEETDERSQSDDR